MGPSGEFLNGGRSSAPNLGDFGAPQYNTSRELYPAWGNERSIPLSKEEIEDIFLDLQQKFAFQRDSMRNMVRFKHCVSHHPALVAHTYHSLTSRCTYLTAVRRACPPTRHSSHFTRITSGGCTQITTSGTLLPSSISSMPSVILQRLCSKWGSGCSHSEKSLTSTLEHWSQAMNNMSQYDRMRQIAL